MGLSIGHLVIVLLLVLVLFGAGKLPRVMGDLGKGIRNMREGMGSDESKQQVIPPAKKRKPAPRKKIATATVKPRTVKSAPRKKPAAKKASVKKKK